MTNLIVLGIISFGMNLFMGWYLIRVSARVRGYELKELSTYIDALYRPFQKLYSVMNRKFPESEKIPILWLNLAFYLIGSVTIIAIDISDVLSLTIASDETKLRIIAGFVTRIMMFAFFLCAPILARPVKPVT